MAHDVFISYSSKDRNVADAVCHALETAKIRCWYAPRDVSAGADWPAAIIHAITDCRAMVYVFTENSKMSEDVTREVQHAFRKGKTVIPFRLEQITATPSLEYYLERVHWLNAFPPPFESYLAALVAHVRANLETPVARNEEEQRAESAKAQRKQQDERLLKEGEKLFADHQTLLQFITMNQKERKELHLERFTFVTPEQWAETVGRELLSRGSSIPTVAWVINTHIAARKNQMVGWTTLATAILLFVIAIKMNSVSVFLLSGVVLSAGIVAVWRMNVAGAKFFNFANPTTAVEQLRLAKLYEWGHQYPTAFGWYLKAAAQGDQSAIWTVTKWYEQGIGLSQDQEAAARWRATAATSGFTKRIG